MSWGREPAGRARLVEIMRAMAEGDEAALWALHDEFGGPLGVAVRALVASFETTLDAEEIDGLVIDACLVLRDHAAAWDPEGGALPWVWARLRLRAMVSTYLGQFTNDLDEAVRHHPAVASATPTLEHPEDHDSATAVLDRLAHHDPTLHRLDEALQRTASPRDRALLLDFRSQQALGDPSPATTVGPMYGVTPAAARKVVSRVSARVRALADDDPRYAEVGALPLVA